ncbi:unnamed protein product [Mycena citricolor]|uniref:F-box domain-containing protein n=1 Tax=Mycena citricolor TaxID=2018698 RepID=A0AAD2H2U6_9AGAR|nr:unnamed protein product [Mycena citricolor]
MSEQLCLSKHALHSVDLQLTEPQARRDAIAGSIAFPILSLPVEITALIFTHCLPDDPLESGSEIPALVLSAVCRDWREIVLARALFWSSWSLDVDRPGGARDTTFIQMWLRRARSNLINVRLYHRDCPGQDDEWIDDPWWDRVNERLPAALDVVFGLQERLESLEISFPSSTLARYLPDEVPADGFPVLKRLVLGSAAEAEGGGNLADHEHFPITYFRAAPQLECATLIRSEDCTFLDLFFIELPFEQLTDFEGTMFSASGALEVLRTTPDLVQATFHLTRGSPLSRGEPFLLARMISLSLWSAGTGASPTDVLDYLVLPDLKLLAMGKETRPNVEHQPSVVERLVERSGCSITHLSLASWPARSVVYTLLHLPSLENLDLHEYTQPQAEEVLRALTCWMNDTSAESNHLGSRLTCFALHCERRRFDRQFSYNAMLDFLYAVTDRPEGVLTLRSFEMEWTGIFPPAGPSRDVLSKLRGLTALGLNIDLHPFDIHSE